MKSNRYRLSCAAGMTVALCCSLFAGAAKAQAQPVPDQPAANDGSLEEIVVTSRLRSESLSQTPVVATVVTGDQLERQGISDIRDLGQIVPDVHISSYFQDDSIVIRGVGTQGSQAGFEEQVGLFVDGVYYGNGHWINSAYFDIDSAEILKGPQGVYFGKNTIAGAFNIKTKDPSNEFEGYVKAGYEIDADERYGEGVVSVPINDTLSVRVAVHGTVMEGWARADLTNTREPGATDTEGRLTIRWAPVDDFDASLKVQFDNYHDNGPFALGVLAHCAGPNFNTPTVVTGFGQAGGASCEVNTNIPTPQYTHDGKSYSDIPSYTGTLQMHWRQDYGELTSITGLNRYSEANLGSENSSTFDGLDQYNEARNEQVSEELRYLTKFDGPLNGLAGVYYQSGAFEQEFAANLIPIAIERSEYSYQKITSQQDYTKAAFAEIQWNPIDTIELDVGARYTDEEKDYTNNSFYVNPIFKSFFGGPILSGKRDDKNLSPQATLTWKPDPDFMAYASYKTGFLSGGYEASFIQSVTSTIGSVTFGPEKVRGGEIGAKFHVLDRSVYFDMDAYYYSYSGLQVNAYNQATLTYLVENAADSVAKGIEVSSTWNVGDGFKLSGSANYNISEYTQYIGQCLQTATFATGCNVPNGRGVFQQNFAGIPTDQAPLWTGRLDATYSHQFEKYFLNTGIGVSATDKYTIDGIYQQSGYARLDANASLEFDAWRFALIGRNLTDKFTCEMAGGRTLGAPSETRCFISRGREIRTEATYRF